MRGGRQHDAKMKRWEESAATATLSFRAEGAAKSGRGAAAGVARHSRLRELKGAMGRDYSVVKLSSRVSNYVVAAAAGVGT